jgi:calcineurin-like phosphoesterase family protein
MARDIWIISDWHLFHENILKFTSNGKLLRPGFDNIEQMHECILDKHNQTVKKGDIVYNLGDVSMRRDEKLVPLVNKMNGSKRLIVGNHDDIKWLAGLTIFQKVQMWRNFPEYNAVLSHVPIHRSSIKWYEDGREIINVHGHIHANKSPYGPYVNVSCEAVDYTPVHIEAIPELYKKQQAEVVFDFLETLDRDPTSTLDTLCSL